MTIERAAYVMAMAILQSPLWEKADNELQVAVRRAIQAASISTTKAGR